MKIKHFFIALVACFTTTTVTFGQNNVGIGTTTPNPNAMGYYYVPHVPLTLRVFSDYVETAPQNNSENVPSYAFYSTIDQEFRWREPYLYGEFDNLDRGVNYPYLNRAHYPYRDYVFRLIPEGTNYQDILGGLNIATQPAVDDCE